MMHSTEPVTSSPDGIKKAQISLDPECFASAVQTGGAGVTARGTSDRVASHLTSPANSSPPPPEWCTSSFSFQNINNNTKTTSSTPRSPLGVTTTSSSSFTWLNREGEKNKSLKHFKKSERALRRHTVETECSDRRRQSNGAYRRHQSHHLSNNPNPLPNTPPTTTTTILILCSFSRRLFVPSEDLIDFIKLKE